MADVSTRTVAIAGASGFVGRALSRRLIAEHRVIGLSRHPRAPAPDGPHSWRACDLFSLLGLEESLEGVDVAVYLVHSMMPTARMTQGSFEDLDLILADNFGRACAKNGVRHIVYLGGLIPPGADLSPHLRSRLEVEHALGAHGVTVTSLRAGLVVGSGGSSFQMLVRLVERLPAMLTPRWTLTETQPIALADVVEMIAYCVGQPAEKSASYDIGGPDIVTYRSMLQDVARSLGRRPLMAPAPLFSPRLSRLWVSLVTGTSSELVGPLVESLRHRMVARDRSFQEKAGIPGIPWTDALAEALQGPTEDRRVTALAKPSVPGLAHSVPSLVRSVQRLPRPPGQTALDVARGYLRWLPRLLWPLLRVRTDGDAVAFHGFWGGKPLLSLRLSPDRSSADRPIFYVTGGILASTEPRGRLEFRAAPDGHHIISALHDFQPRLPWILYKGTQALAHRFVMWRFGAHLHRQVLEERDGRLRDEAT